MKLALEYGIGPIFESCQWIKARTRRQINWRTKCGALYFDIYTRCLRPVVTLYIRYTITLCICICICVCILYVKEYN